MGINGEMQRVSAVIVLMVALVNSQCTNTPGCFCFSSFVTCSGLTSFPRSFPEDTKTITISYMNALEIPGNVLNKLPNLENFEIYSSNISKISKHAFEGMTLVDSVSLNDLHIGTIETHAFTNITDMGTISIYMSTIETIESYAFSDIFALDEINMFMLNITTIKSYAFHKIDELLKFNFYTNNVNTMESHALSDMTNIRTFGMFLNTFDSLGCNNIERMIDESHESSFYSNSVNCSCRLSWVIDNPKVQGQLFSNWCQMPGFTEKIYWDALTRDQLFCDIDSNDGCPKEIFLEETTESSSLTMQTTIPSNEQVDTISLTPIRVETFSKLTTSALLEPISSVSTSSYEYMEISHTPTHPAPTETTFPSSKSTALKSTTPNQLSSKINQSNKQSTLSESLTTVSTRQNQTAETSTLTVRKPNVGESDQTTNTVNVNSRKPDTVTYSLTDSNIVTIRYEHKDSNIVLATDRGSPAETVTPIVSGAVSYTNERLQVNGANVCTGSYVMSVSLTFLMYTCVL